MNRNFESKFYIEIFNRNNQTWNFWSVIYPAKIIVLIKKTKNYSLYFPLGGKNDSAAQMFVYDLMKTDWESRVPHVEAIELNVDIIMSSSPLSATSQSLLNLIRVEKVITPFFIGGTKLLYKIWLPK